MNEDNTANIWEETTLCGACGNVTLHLVEDLLGALHSSCLHCGDETVLEYFDYNSDDDWSDDLDWDEPWYEEDMYDDEEYPDDGNGWD